MGGGGEERMRGRGRHVGKEGGTNHVTSLLLTSPRAATKGGMLSYVLYRIALPSFLSLRREEDEESDPFSVHPHKYINTQRE